MAKEQMKNNKKDQQKLLKNIDELHTTELGTTRIQNNLGIKTKNVAAYLKKKIQDNETIVCKRGKNFYCVAGGIKITILADTFTIITARKVEA